MKVFYNATEQAYRPAHSLFNGERVPYPDVPGRTLSLLDALLPEPGCEIVAAPPATQQELEAVHGPEFLGSLAEVCRRLRPGEEFFPFLAGPHPLLLDSPYPRIRMGYYAVDGSTPLIETSYAAALAAAGTALAGAAAVASGEKLAYALPRPPGHHAGREFFAGYCLVNSAALAASRLLSLGKVAVLDVDFHHGNGTQDIFYGRGDVLYASVHCRPEEAYPYIAGGEGETGSGGGAGYNLNFPLPAGTGWEGYQPALDAACEKVRAFAPAVLVLSAGYDTLSQDPIGNFRLEIEHMEAIGRMISDLGLPLLVVQEGGYHVPSLGPAALKLLGGLGAPGGQEAEAGREEEG